MTTAARPAEERASHYYYPDGRACYEVPKKDGGMRKTHIGDARRMGLLVSPTTLLRILAKPQLEAWKMEMAALAVLTSPRREGEALDAFVKRVIQDDREQDEERDIAAAKGTAIHDAVALALNGDLDYPEELRPYVEAVLKDIMPMGRVAFTERILVADHHAGRCDCALENDTHITLCDFKGTNKIPDKPYDEAVLQISSYCYSLGNTGDKRVRGAIVYIDRNNPVQVATHIVDGEELETAYKRFRLLLDYWRITNRMETPEMRKRNEEWPVGL